MTNVWYHGSGSFHATKGPIRRYSNATRNRSSTHTAGRRSRQENFEREREGGRLEISQRVHGLSKKEKRERFQIRQQRNEMLDDLKKVRRGYTGHYDDSKSPIQNIQSALRQQCLTPLRSSRLDVPNVYPIRKAKSMESMPVVKPVSVASGVGEVQQRRPKSVNLAKKPSPKASRVNPSKNN
ncbi:hypothetical protein OS493_017167 [Desmophyllum pertusum]|uniref:Uncharacterized protein n=1 Tax=Desmophyllum pertusum TaxID=174260 RepID=A0A9X0CF02_9CNID|nr:hypothetical protein OS493_017167 [Desmophyllum pertusum]